MLEEDLKLEADGEEERSEETLESFFTLSSLWEGKLRNESEHHETENTRPSLHPTELQKQGKNRKKRGGGLQSKASGLLALSRIISIINSLSFHSFVSIFMFLFSLSEQGNMSEEDQ